VRTGSVADSVVARAALAVGAQHARLAALGNSRRRLRAEYQCSRFIKRGQEACRGIGGRKKLLVERVLTDIFRPAIDRDVKRRALALAREKLLAQVDVPSERDAIAAALQDAEREGPA
jgi:hypothetical protein